MESLHLAARAKGNTGSGRILLFPMEDQQSLIAVISGTEVHFLQITYRVQLASASLGPIRRAALVSSSLLGVLLPAHSVCTCLCIVCKVAFAKKLPATPLCVSPRAFPHVRP